MDYVSSYFQAFKKDKKVQKGIAFPCCVSVNNCICHFSPMNSDPDVTLKVWFNISDN